MSDEAARLAREEAERAAERAEEERKRALTAAEEARGGAAKQLAELRARVEAARAEQLRARGRLAERERALDAAVREREKTIADLDRDAAAVAAHSPEADALYDRVVALLVELRASADVLLADAERGPRALRVKGSVALPATSAQLAPERDRLRDDLAGLDREAVQLEAEERDATWTALRDVMAAERRVNDMRIALLETVSPAKRDRVLGFGEEGLAQGAREIARVRLELRWLRAAGLETLRDLLAEIRRPAAIARMSFQLLALVAIAWGAVVVRRRHVAWLRWLRSAAARAIRRASLLRLVQRTTGALEATGTEVATLGAVLLVLAVPGLDVRRGPLSVLFVVFVWYWTYRLVLAVAYHGLAWAAERVETVTNEEVSDRILRSVRLVGRTAFFLAVLLASSAAVIGRGYLYALVVRAAWLLGLVVAAALIRRWRDDIADAYLRVSPSGTLSGLVSRTRRRWVGFFVVIAAFGVVVVAWIVRTVRRFVLEFEHSRKALAYLFRRRLEKQVERQPAARPVLAPDVLAFFRETPVDDDELRVARYPGIADFEARVERWRRGERIGATVVVGRTGYGKSSWLAAARERLGDAKIASIVLRDRATTAEEAVSVLARGLEAPSSIKDESDLVRFLRAEKRRVVTVDDAQLLAMRGVGTLEGWRAFAEIVERTADEVLWVVAYAHYPWEYLSWVTRGDHVFRSIVNITRWSEPEIAELLQRRTAASHLAVSYDDLVVEDLGVDASAQVLTTARDYDRLIWDYAEGSPRVALHVWGRSLVPDGEGRARVRLFENPDASILESLGESARFVLAAIVWHERLSLEEAIAVTLLPPLACEDAVERFLEHGIAELEEGGLVVTPRWWPVVVRYLRRKHLIET